MLFNLFTPSYPVVDVNIPEGWWKSDSQLDIDFANKRAYNKSTQFRGRPDSILTYSSPSPKLVWNESGVLKYAPYNLMSYSDDFSNAAWTKVEASVTANNTLSIDNTLTADKITETTVNNLHICYKTFTSVINRVNTVSVYLKAGTRTYGIVRVGGQTPAPAISVDLTNGDITVINAGSSIISTAATPVGDGWYRCSITFTNSVASGLLPQFGPHIGGAVEGYAGDTSKYIYATRAQWNDGPLLDYVAAPTAAVYSLPIDHDPVTYAPLGVLIEEQGTNLLTYSQEFDNAVWTKNASYISATNITAPDDTATAELFVSDTNNAIHFLFVGSPPSICTSGVTYTGSVFLKKGTGSTAPDWMQLSLSGASFGSIQYANFNLTTGEVGAVGSGATARIKDVGGGWYRCSITATATSTFGGSLLVVFTNDNNALGRAPNYVGVTTSNVCVWGAQLEAGAFATSYIPTVASQVTRAADQVSILTSAFGFSATEGSALVQSEKNSTSFKEHLSIDDGTVNERLVLYTSSGQLYFYAADGGVAQLGASGLSTTAPGSLFKAAIAWKLNDAAYVMDGSTVVTDTSITLPTVTKLNIGQSSLGTLQICAHLKRLTIWNTRKSNAELQGLSA